jgi:hypothetical protein
MARRFQAEMSDWFRNTDWNEEIEADFFARLARSKSQRDQYLVLQAISLSDSHPSVALRLVDLYFETRADDFHDDRARRAVAMAQFAQGGHVAALDAYLAMLGGGDAEDKDLFVGSSIEFAFLAARYRSQGHYEAAIVQLSSLRLPDPSQHDVSFRHLAASALLLAETGRDPTGARKQAALALETPDALLATYPDVAWRLRGITRS